MGSFSWVCCCGCGREITPAYNGRQEYDCGRCGEKVLEGKEIIVLMPDGNNIEGHYGDYGQIQQDGETVLEMYAWVGKTNVEGFNDNEKGSNEFWEATREHRDCHKDDGEEKARIAGIYGDSRRRHKETGEILTIEEFRKLEGWGTREFWDTTGNEYEQINVGYEFPIKMGWKYCLQIEDKYENFEESKSAPNQGFGNINELECCGMLVCSECSTDTCCNRY